MKRIFLLLVIAQTLAFASAKAQTLDEIVNKFVERNVVYGQILDSNGIAIKDKFVDTNYVNFLQIGNIDNFLKLLKHSNPIVQTYAGWALIDKSYPKLDEIYLYFLKNDTVVSVSGMCFTLDYLVSQEFYYKYRNALNLKERETDKMLQILDSISLYNYKPYFHVDRILGSSPAIDITNGYFTPICYGLENRKYSESFLPQIEFLALEKLNDCAIRYLASDSLKKEKINGELFERLENATFKAATVDEYYKTVYVLIKLERRNFRRIIKKLKADPSWKLEKKKFQDIFSNIDLEKVVENQW
jgi:hypothetical protein